MQRFFDQCGAFRADFLDLLILHVMDDRNDQAVRCCNGVADVDVPVLRDRFADHRRVDDRIIGQCMCAGHDQIIGSAERLPARFFIGSPPRHDRCHIDGQHVIDMRFACCAVQKLFSDKAAFAGIGDILAIIFRSQRLQILFDVVL